MLNEEIIACVRCPRLIAHCRKVGEIKRRAYLDWDYWAKPVPGFGDPNARLLILGLAPGAHGSNRTGRPFTGDGSGNFMYPILHKAGFASQPTAIRREDGLELIDAYITAAVRCAPPENKPLPEEIGNCAPFLDREFAALTNVKVVVVLGKIAFDAYLNYLKRRGELKSKSRNSFWPWRNVQTAGRAHTAVLVPSFTAKHTHRQADRKDVSGCVQEGEEVDRRRFAQIIADQESARINTHQKRWVLIRAGAAL